MRLNDQLALMEEFERSAENRRWKASRAIENEERVSHEERLKKAEREEKEHRRFEEAMAATSEQVVHFNEQLDRYDTGTVSALMDNREALDRAEHLLSDMRDRAHMLPDGRRVYRSENGQNVFDDGGNRVGRDVIDPAAIGMGTPSWEQRQQAGEAVNKLTTERDGLLTYQAQVDQARERAGRDGVSQADLQALGDDLDRTMPEAVRRRLEGPRQDSRLDGSPVGPQFDLRDAPKNNGVGNISMQPS